MSQRFTKKQLAIGAGLALLGSLAGVFAINENLRNQRLAATQTANNCIEKNWCGQSVTDLDLDLLPPDVRTKLETHMEKRAERKREFDAEITEIKRKGAEEAALRATLGDWYYGNRTDDATGNGYKIARVPSENSLNLRSPYDGEQRAYLQMRSHPRFGFSASVDIPRGQILCDNFNNTTVLVRFDDGPAVPYSCGEAADYSTNVVYIKGPKQFEAGLKKAKMAHITMNLYQEGSKTMTFKVNGYDSGKV